MLKVETPNKTFYFNDTATPEQIGAYLIDQADIFNETHSIILGINSNTLFFSGDEDFNLFEIETINPVF
jgi:hypothetical protein